MPSPGKATLALQFWRDSEVGKFLPTKFTQICGLGLFFVAGLPASLSQFSQNAYPAARKKEAKNLENDFKENGRSMPRRIHQTGTIVETASPVTFAKLPAGGRSCSDQQRKRKDQQSGKK